MSDEKGKGAKETIVEESKALVGKVYDDAAKPSLEAVGKTTGGVVRLLLRPIDAIVRGANALLDKLGTRVEAKLANVPPDRLLAAPATIAAPAALQYALLGDGDEVRELRELFENLLVSSMDRDTAANVHPAFVTMIAQLTSDEAWILKSIDRQIYAASEIFEFTDAGKTSLGIRTLLGIGIGIDETRIQQYVSNLDRLGIPHIDWANAGAENEYDAVRDLINKEFPANEAFPPNRSAHGGSIRVTPLGRQFLDTCVRPRRE